MLSTMSNHSNVTFWKFFVLIQKFLQLGEFSQIDFRQDLLTLVTFWESEFIFRFIIWVDFMIMIRILSFLVLTTHLPFLPDIFIVSLHGLGHFSDCFSILTKHFMVLYIFLPNEVKSIIAAPGKQMHDFLSIFASIDVKHQFVLPKDMVWIEWTRRLFTTLILLKHFSSNIISKNKKSPFNELTDFYKQLKNRLFLKPMLNDHFLSID